MCTCRCRKLRLDPYEGMDLREKMTAATHAGDWQTARDCFDELEEQYNSYYAQEQAAAKEAERKRVLAEHACGEQVHLREAAEAARDKAEEALGKILMATPEEVVEYAVEKRIQEEREKILDKTRREVSRYLPNTLSPPNQPVWSKAVWSTEDVPF